ncbi:CHY zinc finger protein [Micrococcus porci]|uniref:CHY zinc finger protein n=1 Tax=Micrococcus porci TaxID=2856555 RepID=UPI003CEE6355
MVTPAEPGPAVRGVDADPQTRCAHYRTERDVVALRLDCCPEYWCCRECHDELAGHPGRPLPREAFGLPSVLCGVCRHEMDVPAYRAAMAHADPHCPACGAGFNPGCSRHAHLYFVVDA